MKKSFLSALMLILAIGVNAPKIRGVLSQIEISQ